ncbi:hypothetical protein MRX96_054532 [Rhipicephalus microplus]
MQQPRVDNGNNATDRCIAEIAASCEWLPRDRTHTLLLARRHELIRHSRHSLHITSRRVGRAACRALCCVGGLSGVDDGETTTRVRCARLRFNLLLLRQRKKEGRLCSVVLACATRMRVCSVHQRTQVAPQAATRGI